MADSMAVYQRNIIRSIGHEFVKYLNPVPILDHLSSIDDEVAERIRESRHRADGVAILINYVVSVEDDNATLNLFISALSEFGYERFIHPIEGISRRDNVSSEGFECLVKMMRGDMISKIKTPEVVPELIRRGCLSEEDQEVIEFLRHSRGNMSACREMFNRLPRLKSDWAWQFFEALRETEHSLLISKANLGATNEELLQKGIVIDGSSGAEQEYDEVNTDNREQESDVTEREAILYPRRQNARDLTNVKLNDIYRSSSSEIGSSYSGNENTEVKYTEVYPNDIYRSISSEIGSSRTANEKAEVESTEKTGSGKYRDRQHILKEYPRQATGEPVQECIVTKLNNEADLDPHDQNNADILDRKMQTERDYRERETEQVMAYLTNVEHKDFYRSCASDIGSTFMRDDMSFKCNDIHKSNSEEIGSSCSGNKRARVDHTDIKFLNTNRSTGSSSEIGSNCSENETIDMQSREKVSSQTDVQKRERHITESEHHKDLTEGNTIKHGDIETDQSRVGQDKSLTGVQTEVNGNIVSTYQQRVLGRLDRSTDPHSGDGFLYFEDGATDKRKFIQLVDKLKSKTIPEVREIIRKAKLTLNDHSENGTAVVNRINGWTNGLISQISKARTEMIQEVERKQLDNRKKLVDYKKSMKNYLSNAEELVHSCQNKIKIATDDHIAKMGLHLQTEVLEIGKEIELFPTVKKTIFIPGAITNVSIRYLLGRCVDKEPNESQRSTDALIPQRMSHVIETKFHVDSEFQHETDKGSVCAIATHENHTAWITTFQGNEIKHVDETGHVDKTLTFTTRISDVVVTNDGELLVTPNGGSGGHQYQIKKVNSKGDIVAIVDMKPLRPFCICTSKTGHIYVGCIDHGNYDVTDKNTRSVMKLTSTGIVQQSCQYDDKGQRLFTLPQKLQENVNGDVWVYDRTAKTKGRVVVIHQDGKLRFIYTGARNDKITKNFNPCDITAAGNGNMLICDTNNHIVQVVDENGTLLYFLGSQHKSGIGAPISISLDKKHNQLWIGNLNGQVQVLRLK